MVALNVRYFWHNLSVPRDFTQNCARHMAFDDLEWVSDTSFRLGDRVWAQGREARKLGMQLENVAMNTAVTVSDG